jgi:hypothetical protein
MKRRKLLLLPVFLLLLAGCKDTSSSVSVEDSQPTVTSTSEVEPSSEEPQVTSVEDTEAPPSIPTVSEPPEEEFLSIKDARALAGQEETVKLRGVVTAIYGMASATDAVLLQQDEHAITAVFVDRTITADFNLGDTLIATGKVADFNGLIQLSNASFVKSTEPLAAIEPYVLTEWNPTALEGMDGRWAKAEGLIKVGGTIDAGKNSPIDVKFEGMEGSFQLYMSAYIAEADRLALAEKINTMGSTDTINFEGPIGRYNNFQLNPVNADTVTIVKGEATGEPVDATALDFTPTSGILEVEKTLATTLVATPADATLDELVYTTEDATVATVDNKGVITGVAVGKTNITATVPTSTGGEVVGTFAVEVVAKGTIVIPSPDLGRQMVADENNAFDMNLDQELFYVGSDKGSTTNQVGMYADIRLYGDRNTGDGNTLSLYVAAGKVVTSVDIEWSAHTNPPQTAVFKYGAEEVTLTEDADLTGMYGKADLSINGFAIKNASTGGEKNAQIRIKSIRVILADGDPTSVLPGQPTAEQFVKSATIAEFLGLPQGYKARLSAVVTNMGPYNSFSMEDATAAVAFRKSGINAANTPFAVGDKVSGTFKKADFNGLIQAELQEDAPTVEAGPHALTLEKVDLGVVGLTAEALAPYQSRLVTGELSVKTVAKKDANNNISIVLTNGTDDITLRLDSRLPKFAEFEFLMDLAVGDVVVLDGAVIGWYNGPQLAADDPVQVVKKVAP